MLTGVVGLSSIISIMTQERARTAPSQDTSRTLPGHRGDTAVQTPRRPPTHHPTAESTAERPLVVDSAHPPLLGGYFAGDGLLPRPRDRPLLAPPLRHAAVGSRTGGSNPLLLAPSRTLLGALARRRAPTGLPRPSSPRPFRQPAAAAAAATGAVRRSSTRLSSGERGSSGSPGGSRSEGARRTLLADRLARLEQLLTSVDRRLQDAAAASQEQDLPAAAAASAARPPPTAAEAAAEAAFPTAHLPVDQF